MCILTMFMGIKLTRNLTDSYPGQPVRVNVRNIYSLVNTSVIGWVSVELRFVWPEGGSVARSCRLKTNRSVRVKQKCYCPKKTQSKTDLLYIFIFFNILKTLSTRCPLDFWEKKYSRKQKYNTHEGIYSAVQESGRRPY